MKPRTNCFAYNDEIKDCNALKELYCKYGDCKFYKSCEELNPKYIENCIKSYRYKYQNSTGE